MKRIGIAIATLSALAGCQSTPDKPIEIACASAENTQATKACNLETIEDIRQIRQDIRQIRQSTRKIRKARN